MLTRKLLSGHTFAFRFRDGAWGHGRILLNMQEQCVKPKRLPPGSPIGFFSHAFLVELMREVTDEADAPATTPLVTGIFVDDRAFRKDVFTMTGVRAVTANDIDFPQNVARQPDPVFVRGEVWLPIGVEDDEVLRLEVGPALHMSGGLPRIAAHHLGRPSEDEAIPPEWRGVQHGDVRFSPHRARVLETVDDPEALTLPYLELARAHGVDPGRFLV